MQAERVGLSAAAGSPTASLPLPNGSGSAAPPGSRPGELGADHWPGAMPDGVARAGSGAADGEIPDKVPDILWGTFAPAIQARVGAIHRELREQKADGTFPQDKDLLWMKALVRFMEVIDGRAAALAKAPEKKPDSWWATNVTGLMVISAFLALAFGVLGVFGLASSGTAKEATAGFLDIAKLFAGALVGAAGAVVAAKR